MTRIYLALCWKQWTILARIFQLHAGIMLGTEDKTGQYISSSMLETVDNTGQNIRSMLGTLDNTGNNRQYQPCWEHWTILASIYLDSW